MTKIEKKSKNTEKTSNMHPESSPATIAARISDLLAHCKDINDLLVAYRLVTKAILTHQTSKEFIFNKWGLV